MIEVGSRRARERFREMGKGQVVQESHREVDRLAGGFWFTLSEHHPAAV